MRIVILQGVSLTTTGGTGPYTCRRSSARTSNNFQPWKTTLDPGAGTNLSWIITVRDVNGCTVNVPVTIAVDPSQLLR
jgi:hypothetical protein